MLTGTTPQSRQKIRSIEVRGRQIAASARIIRKLSYGAAISRHETEEIESELAAIETNIRAIRELLLAPEQPTTQRPTIRAECYSDDHHVEIKFDAVKYFEQATDNELRELIECEFGGDYAADEIARFFEANVTAPLFDYLATGPRMSTDDTVGFECHVDETDAVAWIKTHRPHLETPALPGDVVESDVDTEKNIE